MTDDVSAYDAACSFARLQVKEADRAQLFAQAMPANKAALFDALAHAGVI